MATAPVQDVLRQIEQPENVLADFCAEAPELRPAAGASFWRDLEQEERRHASHIEQSIIESKSNEIVKTNDAEYHALIQQVVTETVAHTGKIVSRLSSGQGR